MSMSRAVLYTEGLTRHFGGGDGGRGCTSIGIGRR